jgi:hypothetical protein
MKRLAMVKGPASIARCLAVGGEATEVKRRSPSRGPRTGRAASVAGKRSVTRTGCHSGGSDEAPYGRERGAGGGVERGVWVKERRGSADIRYD